MRDFVRNGGRLDPPPPQAHSTQFPVPQTLTELWLPCPLFRVSASAVSEEGFLLETERNAGELET